MTKLTPPPPPPPSGFELATQWSEAQHATAGLRHPPPWHLEGVNKTKQNGLDSQLHAIIGNCGFGNWQVRHLLRDEIHTQGHHGPHTTVGFIETRLNTRYHFYAGGGKGSFITNHPLDPRRRLQDIQVQGCQKLPRSSKGTLLKDLRPEAGHIVDPFRVPVAQTQTHYVQQKLQKLEYSNVSVWSFKYRTLTVAGLYLLYKVLDIDYSFFKVSIWSNLRGM